MLNFVDNPQPFHHWSPFLCAECYGIQHIKTGFSGERVKPYVLLVEGLTNRESDRLKHVDIGLLTGYYFYLHYNITTAVLRFREILF